MPPSASRQARLNRDLTIIELAQRTSLQASRISVLERGIIRPRPDEVDRLAAALGLPGSELFPPNENTIQPQHVTAEEHA